MSSSYPSPQGSGIDAEEEAESWEQTEVLDHSKEILQGPAGLIHIRIHEGFDSRHMTDLHRLDIDKIPALRRGVDTESHP